MRIPSASRLIGDGAKVLTYLACTLLVILNVHYLLKYAVNIPYHDDWEQYFQFVDGMSLGEFFAVHNEHRILLTRVQTWLLLHWTDWNIVTAQIINLVIYIAGVAGLVWFVHRRVPELPAWVLAAFGLFALSPRLFQNHLWAFQSQFHFAWILCFAAAALLFRQRAGPHHAAAAAVCAFLAAWSFSGGLVGSVVLVLVFVGSVGAKAWTNGRLDGSGQVLSAVVFLVPTLISVGVWLVLYERPEFHPVLRTPFGLDFWWFFANMVSNGFGIETVSRLWGVVCVLLVVTPIIGLLYTKQVLQRMDALAVVTCLLSILAMLAGVTLGRAGWQIETAKASRYAEFAGLLPLLSAATWGLLLRNRRRWLVPVLLGLWSLCAVGFADDWDFHRYYQPVAESRLAGRACVEAYYFHGGDGICTDIWWPVSMNEMLDDSRRMGLSFYREMAREHEAAAIEGAVP